MPEENALVGPPEETVGPIPLRSSQDFEVSAFDILDKAPDYNTGVNELVQTYGDGKFDNPESAKALLSDYGNSLRYKFKTDSLDFSTVTDMLPVKPSDAVGDTTVDQINDWEKKNKEFLDSTNDPDYVASKDLLTQHVTHMASEARRDQLGERGEGAWAWWTDKGFRLAHGAIGPFAKLVGNDDLDRELLERTQRSRDEGTMGTVASALGSVIPMLAASATGPVGAGAVIAAQAAGEARGAYKSSLQATGDPERAAESAALTVGAQALQLLPLGRAAEGFVGAFAKKVAVPAIEEGGEKTLTHAILEGLDAQKTTFGNVAVNTLAAGILGSAGQLVGNVANNIGLNENGDITHGAIDAFLANSLIGGGFSSAHALIENAAIEQVKNVFKDADKLHEESIAKEASVPPKKLKTRAEATKDQVPDLMVKDSEGYWVPNEASDHLTSDQQTAVNNQYHEASQDYLNKEPASFETHVTDESGEAVKLPVHQDYEVADFPAKAIIVGEDSQEGLRPSKFMTYMFSKLGGKLQLSKNILDGAFGSFNPKSKTIKILRSLGANDQLFTRVMAHEGGHLIDGYLNDAFTESPALDSVAKKLLGIKSLVQESFEGEPALNEEAKQLSMRYRPGWDGKSGEAQADTMADKFRQYRNNPKEIYADTVSALLNNPEWVKDNFSNVYKSFEIGLRRAPAMNEFWNKILQFERDPGELSRFNMEVAKESRQKQGNINAAVRADKIANNTFQAKLQRNLDIAYSFFFDRKAVIRKGLNKLPADARLQGQDMLHDIGDLGMAKHIVDERMLKPLRRVLSKFLQTGIEPNTWAQYEYANRVLNDSTNTMENIKDNPALYREAAVTLREMLRKEKGVKSSILDSALSDEQIASVKGLTDGLAQIGVVGDTAEVLNLQDFIGRYDPSDPARAKKGQRDYILAAARLNQKKVSLPIESLREKVGKLGNVPHDVKAAMQEILKDNAFAARRYLVNAGGYTTYDATRDITHIENFLGREKYQALRDVSQEYHAALNSTRDLITKSQIFAPDLLRRMDINSDNYVTANVLKYFEGDEKISSGVRSAIGSLSETGNEINTTAVKMQMITSRAIRQIAANRAIEFAKLSNQVVDTIRSTPGKDIFAQKEKLSKYDKDHSYLIGYEKGNPTLYKIAGGKSYENTLNHVRGGPVLDLVLDITDKLNNAFLTRQLKTSLSPAFVLGQKFYDRKIEAILANSFEPTLGLPIHTSKQLRRIDKKSLAEIAHYRKTGELTGSLKTLIDLNGAALEIATNIDKGIDHHQSFSDAVYEEFGNKMPDRLGALEKFGKQTEAFLGKLGGDWLADVAQRDELRTKINGFQIGKEVYGMSDKAAATFARDNFGIPDPGGGGVGSPLINRMFLFGAAHLGGLKVLKDFVKDNPKAAAMQGAYRIVLPKLLMSAPVMGYLLGKAFGPDQEETYKTLYGMVPTNELQSRDVTIFGAQDPQGNYHNLFSLKAGEVNPATWKAWYGRVPQSREITAATKVLWPLVVNLAHGEVGDAITETVKGAKSVGSASISPMIQYGMQIWDLIQGENPTDYFRMKGILNKDVVASGSFGRKLYDYGTYVAAQQAPSIIGYNPFQTAESKSTGESLLKSPLVGPLMRSMVGVSNYGNYETLTKGEEEQTRRRADIKLSTGDSTKDLLNQYAVAQSTISKIGKGWQNQVGSEQAAKIRQLTSWNAKVYLKYREELEAAQSAGDSERYAELLKQLEASSESVREALK